MPFPIGARVRAWWSGGCRLKKGWYFAKVRRYDPTAKKVYKYTVRFEVDGKEAKRTKLQVQPEVEPPGQRKTIPLTIANRQQRALRSAYNGKPGMYVITAFGDKDIVKVGYSSSLGRRMHEYELYWIDLPITIHAMLILPSACIAAVEERRFHREMHRLGVAHPGRWRTVNTTEWYKWSATKALIQIKLRWIHDRHASAGAFLTWNPGAVRVAPRQREPSEVKEITREKEDPIHGKMYRATWRDGSGKSWLAAIFFMQEGGSHVVLDLWEKQKKNYAHLLESKRKHQRGDISNNTHDCAIQQHRGGGVVAPNPTHFSLLGEGPQARQAPFLSEGWLPSQMPAGQAKQPLFLPASWLPPLLEAFLLVLSWPTVVN